MVMMPRQMVQWRVYVYANSLFSLPGRETRGFREWSPEIYSHNPHDVHRVMNWVNRDISVLVGAKSEVYAVFELIMDMLPQLSMGSDDFKASLAKHLGEKTYHFVHELINFARSPYDDLIAYECNVQYKALEDDFDGPSTSAEARRMGHFVSSGLHNFVEFSRRINPDDCVSFEADLQLEDEDVEALDDLVLERNDVSMMMLAMEQSVAASRSVARFQAPSAVASMAADAQQQQQQLQQALAGELPVHVQSPQLALANYELQMAIERSMFDEGLANEFLPPTGRTVVPVVMSNRQAARQLMAANLFRIVQGPQAGATGTGAGGTGGAAAVAGTAAETLPGAGGGAEAGSVGGGGAVAVNMANQNINYANLRVRMRPRLRLRQRR